MNYFLGILTLGALFGLFGLLHLKWGDVRPGSCSGDGACGTCHGTCEEPERAATPLSPEDNGHQV